MSEASVDLSANGENEKVTKFERLNLSQVSILTSLVFKRLFSPPYNSQSKAHQFSYLFQISESPQFVTLFYL